MLPAGAVPTIKLLGGAVILVGDAPLGGPAAHRHRLALLAVLAASDRPVSRDKLIALLWPSSDEEQGRNSLKTAVHELRKLIGEDAIRTIGDQLSLDLTLSRCDVSDFRVSVAAHDAERAVSLYAGPFLDGFYLKQAPQFEHWVDAERARFAAAYAHALDQLATSAEQRGDAHVAVRWWRALAAHDRLRADVAMRLMRALEAAGDRQAAIRYAEIHAVLRQQDLGAEPDPAVAQLARELAAQPAALVPPMSRPVPPSRDRDTASGTLPRPRRRGIRWPAWPVTVAAVLVVGTLATLAAVYRPARMPGAIDANVIAILPFRVSGADPSLAYLRDGMAELLAAEFTGEGGARSVDPGTVSRAVTRAGETREGLDQSQALALAGEVGAGQVLVGAVVGTPGRMTITASILNVPGGDVRVPAVLAGGPADSLAALVGEVSSRLLSRGTGGWRLSTRDPGTTSSEALRAFVAGRASYHAGRLNDGFRQYSRALDIDSTFVLAAYWQVLNGAMTRPVSEAELERAKRLAWQQRDRLGPDQRMLLAAELGPHGPAGSDNAADVHEALERAAAHLTASAEAWALLGDSYFHRGAMLGYEDWLDRARTAFERSVSLEPALGSVTHLATIAFIQRDMPAHARWLRELERLAPDHGYTIRERYAAAVVAGDRVALHAAREQYVRHGDAYLDSYDGNDWVVGLSFPAREVDSLYRSLATFASESQRVQVWHYLVSAATSAGQPARAWEAASHYTTRDDLGYNFGLLHSAEDDSAAAELLAAHPTLGIVGLERRCEVALSRLRRGDTTGAAATAAMLRAVTDPDYPDSHTCDALITAIVASLRPGAGTASLVRADSMLRTYPAGMPPIWNYDVALAFARHGDYRAAATAARRRLLARTARLAISLRDEGGWALQAGDTTNAVRAWQRYLVIREQAEPPFKAEVDSVRRRLAHLAGR